MNIVFLGSGTFAAPTFQALLDAGHHVALAVTPPPRRSGRGKHMHVCPMAALAGQRGVEVYPCADVNTADAREIIASKSPDVLVVVEFGQFLSTAVRELATLDAINLHASVLPALRGAAPINFALYQGLASTGVSTFSLVDKMDAGPVYDVAQLDILPDERAGELRERLASLGATLLLKTLLRFAHGDLTSTPQDHEAATFAPKLRKADGHLDFSLPAEEVVSRVRGSWPWPGAKAEFHRVSGKIIPVTIAGAREAEGIADVDPGQIEPGLTIACGSGRLEILEIQPAGKRVMTWNDFCNGYRVVSGGFFRTPEVRPS